MNTLAFRCLFLLYALFIFTGSTRALAQQQDSTNVIIAKIVTIHSNILNQDRKLYINTPEMWPDKTFSGQAYPVMYLMDGDTHTALAASQVSYLSSSYNAVPAMIVVGIDNYDYDRMHDLTPTHFDNGLDGKVNAEFKTTGGGELFLRFVKEEVMPYINAHYKTQPFSIFSGHSLGGLMATYCLVHHPDYFNAYIAISPAVWVDANAEVNDVMKNLNPEALKHKFFFISDGNEGGLFHRPIGQIDSVMQRRQLPYLTYRYINYPNETHGTEPVKAIYDGLRLVYPNWDDHADTTFEMIKKHFIELTDTYGYRIVPTEGALNAMGYNLMYNPAKIDEAIEVLKFNAVLYPRSANVHDSLGDAYAKKGEKPAAIKCYREALAINPNSKESKAKLDDLLKGK